MRRIVIINQACGNRGDEAAHKAFVKALLGDGCLDVTSVTVGVADGALSCMKVPGAGYVNLRPGSLYYKLTAGALEKRLGFLWVLSGTARRLAREMKSADAVVCAPGGMDLGGFRSWHHLFLMRMALRYAQKVAYFGRSIGPFEDDRFAALSAAVLRRCSFVSLRDARSWAIGDSLGLNWRRMLDVVFADVPVARGSLSGLCAPAVPGGACAESDSPSPVPAFDPGESIPLNAGAAARYCVVVPNSLRWHPAFRSGTGSSGTDVVESFFVDILRGVAERFPGIDIVLLPQLFGEPDVNQGDVEFFRRLADASGLRVLDKDSLRGAVDYSPDCDGTAGDEGSSCDTTGVCVLPDTLDSAAQRSIVAGAEFLVGARYHSIVFAASAGVPFLSLTYEDKMKGLVEKFPLPSVAEYDLRGGLDAGVALSHLDGMSLSRFADSPELAGVRALTLKCLTDLKEWLADD